MSNAPAVDYAIRIIEYFAEKGSALGIADISNALTINKNAVSRVLGALIESGWLYCCDPIQKKYALTIRPFSMLSRCVTGDELQRLAKPHVQTLFEQTGDSTYLGIRHEANVIYTQHFNSVGDVCINARVGGEYPLHCSAPGKVLLAWADDREISDYFAGTVAKRTAQTITTESVFRVEAHKIRKQYYALDIEEFAPGIVCAAAPIFNADGRVIATVGISTLTIYHDTASLISTKVPQVCAAAAHISAALGYRT